MKLAADLPSPQFADQKARPGMMSKAKLYEILHLKGSRSSIEGTWDEYQPLPC